MEYILIDNFNGDLNIVCKEDGSGEPEIYDTLKEAEEGLKEACQNGQIIPLGVDIMALLEECHTIISDLGAEGELADPTLSTRLDEILNLEL